MAGQSELFVDWIFDLILVVDILDVFLCEFVIDGWLYSETALLFLEGLARQSREPLLLFWVETDIVVLLFEGVIDLLLNPVPLVRSCRDYPLFHATQ